MGREETFGEPDYKYPQYPFLSGDTGRRVMICTEEWKLMYFIDKTDSDGALYSLKEDGSKMKNLYNESKCRGIIKKLKTFVTDWNASV